MSKRARQRGVALITAVLIVALATMLAVKIGFDAYLDYRRAAGVYAFDQSFEVALGAEAWAADILQSDFNADKTRTHLQQKWATPLPPLPIDDGEIVGRLDDLQGRFNLNNLRMPAAADEATRKRHLADAQQFKRLLELLQIEPMWADRIVDWIDDDNVETFPDGMEDNGYSGLSPPYLAANMAITRVSELLAIKDFGLERYRKLEPYVSALPAGARINVCTAPGAVLDSFSYAGKAQQFSLSEKTTSEQRSGGCWPDLPALEKNLNAEEVAHLRASAGTMSQHFQATVAVTIGSNQFTLYSHLARNRQGQARAQLRSFGSN